MSVIVDLSLPASEFHLGRILEMIGETRVELESVVPLGNKSVPFVRVFEGRDFFEGILVHDGTITGATGTETTWAFEVRFEEHERLSSFQQFCLERGLDVSFDRLYNPTKPDAGPWYGLTAAQRTALLRAVEEGYYSIPREINTRELAAEFGISDQALTERLRRGVTNLVGNTIQVSEELQARSK